MDKLLFDRLISFGGRFHELEYELTYQAPLEGVSPLQYRILQYLLVGGPSGLSQLALCMDMSLPNCSREVRKLTESGYLQKDEGEGDRRRILIALSPAGSALVTAVFAHMQSVLAKRVGTLPASSRAQLIEALDTVESLLMKKS